MGARARTTNRADAGHVAPLRPTAGKVPSNERGQCSVSSVFALDDDGDQPLPSSPVHPSRPAPAVHQLRLCLVLLPPGPPHRVIALTAVGNAPAVPTDEPGIAAQEQHGHAPPAARACKPQATAAVVARCPLGGDVLAHRLAVHGEVERDGAALALVADPASFLPAIGIAPHPGTKAASREHAFTRPAPHVYPKAVFGLDVHCRSASVPPVPALSHDQHPALNTKSLGKPRF